MTSCMQLFVVQAMTAYSKLSKLNHKTLQQEVFFPLRVVGLANELGHKLVHEGGLLELTAEHLRNVHVSGDCRLEEEGRWRKVRSHTLEVRKQDAELAYKLVRKHLRNTQMTWQHEGGQTLLRVTLSGGGRRGAPNARAHHGTGCRPSQPMAQ